MHSRRPGSDRVAPIQRASAATNGSTPEQVRAVAAVLTASPSALPVATVEAHFKGRGPWKKGLPLILDTLAALGRARCEAQGWRGV